MKAHTWVVAVAIVAGVSASVLAVEGEATPSPKTQPAVAEKDRQFVADTLDKVKAGDYEAMQKAEEALVAKGPGLLPALREGTPYDFPEKDRARQGAIVRLTWKINPTTLIRDWIKAKVKATEAPPPVTPLMFAQYHVIVTFPEQWFYLVVFPSGPGANAIPEPLKNRNVFLVDKAGKVLLVKTVEELKSAFAAVTARKKSEVTWALCAWLLVDCELAGDGKFHFVIRANMKNISEWDSEGRLLGWCSAEGMDPHMYGSSGRVFVEMIFAPDGTLTKIEESRKIDRGSLPIFPIP